MEQEEEERRPVAVIGRAVIHPQLQGATVPLKVNLLVDVESEYEYKFITTHSDYIAVVRCILHDMINTTLCGLVGNTIYRA